MSIKIYTDGGCSGNPGPGGWAYVIVRDKMLDTFEDERGGGQGPKTPLFSEGKPEIIAEKYGGELNTTNNRMELAAAMAALEDLPSLDLRFRYITVLTDSQYLQKGMSLWLAGWKRNAWRTSDRKLVKNRDLWERLDSLSRDLLIKWIWIKGHGGNEFNERCDRMTQQAIAGLSQGALAKDFGMQKYLFPH